VLLSQKHLSFATAILLAGALCIHSILEGIALGAQANLRDKQHIMLAIVAHKGLAAYALGASIMESKVRGAGCLVSGGVGLVAQVPARGVWAMRHCAGLAASCPLLLCAATVSVQLLCSS
jgi:zinc transporter ZupT